MARRSQCSSAGDNPLDPNYLPPHYREEYRLAIDALVEEDLEGYYQFLQKADVVDFLSTPEIQHIQTSIQVPQQSSHPEQYFLEFGGDGSSDTYWPLHSDLDAPGLDLGWPQLHHFIGPTEVTTLVNPPEPDMPSIKDQARRLVKNAKQVIAVAMDIFTDVDMFADILNAAMRNVAVYIILDEQNAQHFLDMVSNCRVNLQSIQFLRVRTVSGIKYQCRTGKSFKGQMMDRFLLTDCRAVLSGNYSFMWSYEKLHRCMAHLFLGQLVSTFDEEFRILYAQSQPLKIGPMDDLGHSQIRKYPNERTSLYREPRKFLDPGHPDEWLRHSYDVEGDWRMMPLKRQEPPRGPADMYSRFPSQQLRMDPSFDQGPSRIPMMENLTTKRHSYAEGIHGRFPFLQQQGMPDSEAQGRQFHRGQQPYPIPGREPDYSAYDKFWNQDYLSGDQYSEPGLPQEMQPPDSFDPVLNYLSSRRNPDFEQSSEKLLPAGDVPFSSSQPRRQSLTQPYACQTSPTPSNPSDQKQFFQEPNTDRKDPSVKRGLRNWRISSYLSAYDNPGDEGLPLAPPQESDPFEEPPNPIQQTAPGIDLSFPKIPNVREFKVPAVPRASQIPSYAKAITREQPKKLLDEPAADVAETKITPTPSESSSTTEGEKTEEAEQKEPKTSVLRREESFRRNYSPAVQRSSRLRSSLIFSSLDQQNTSQDQQDEESDKNEADQTKLPFVSHILGQRRSAAREPFEWNRYIKSATFDSSSTETTKPEDGGSKADDKDDRDSKEQSSKDLSENPKAQESIKPPDVEQGCLSASVPLPKHLEAELPKTDLPVQQPKPLLAPPLYVDMSDPDNRLMFFKELAAKRKAAKAAEAEKSKEKAPLKPPTDLKNETAVSKEEPGPKQATENTALASECVLEENVAAESAGKTISTEVPKSDNLSLDASEKINKQDSLIRNDPSASQSCKAEQTMGSVESETIEQVNTTPAVNLPETEASQSKLPEEQSLPNPAVKQSKPSLLPTPTNTTPDNVSCPAQGTDQSESQSLDSTSEDCNSVTANSAGEPASSALGSNFPNSESVKLETSICAPPLPSQQDTGSESGSSNPSVQSSSSDHTSSPPLLNSRETKSSNITPEDSSSTPASSILPPNVDTTEGKQSVSPSPQESSQSAEQTSLKSEKPGTQTHLDSVSQLTSETSSTTDSAHVESDLSPDVNAGAQLDTSSLQATTNRNAEEVSGTTPSAKESQKDISRQEKDVSESEKIVSDSDKHVSESHKDVSESENVASESEKHIPEMEKDSCATEKSVSQSGRDIHESEKDVSESEKDVSESVKDGSESEKGVSQSGKDIPESEKAVFESEKVVSDSENPVSESQTDVSESEKGVSQSGKDIPETEKDVLESEKDVLESEKDVLESEKDVLESEKDVLESEKGVSESQKDVSESEKGVSQSGKEIPETEKGVSQSGKDVSESEEGVSPSKDTVSDSGKVLSESEIHSFPEAVAEVSEVLESSKDVKADSTSPSLSPSMADSGLQTIESSASKPDLKEAVTPKPTSADTTPEHLPSETSLVNTDFNPVSQSEKTSSPQEATRQATPPSNLNVAGFNALSPVETVPHLSSPSESVGSVLSPEAKKTETNMSAVNSSSDMNSGSSENPAESNKAPKHPSTKSPSSLTEPTSKAPTGVNLPCKTPESVTSESRTHEPTVSAENGQTEPELLDAGEKKSDETKDINKLNESTTQGSVSSEKTNDQGKQNNSSEPGEVTSKQPKSSQSRYHSSTANVLSSSNLRDDTKLLLEKISANSQSRNETAKESAVTDDEKEDEADKNAKREKERGIGTLNRGQPKLTQEREKLLERIQSMRKERKVYSRFEMAP